MLRPPMSRSRTLSQKLPRVSASQQRRSSASSVTNRVAKDPLVGTTVDGDFEVERPLGTGSHADVFLARQRGLRRRLVALKVLSRHYLSLREGDRRRAATGLVKEGELLASLRSACFVSIHRAGALPDGRPYLALEYAPGTTLAELIAGGERLDAAQAVQVAEQVAEALAELHEMGFIHRDVTPANLMIESGQRGRLRVRTYDLGTVTRVSERPDKFRVGYDPEHPFGTLGYMSPEQASAGLVEATSDQFSLAAVLYEGLTGARPVMLDGQGGRAVLRYLRGDEPIPMEPLDRLVELPANFVVAMHRALSRDPSRRHDDVLAFADALRRASVGAPSASSDSLVARVARGFGFGKGS